MPTNILSQIKSERQHSIFYRSNLIPFFVVDKGHPQGNNQLLLLQRVHIDISLIKLMNRKISHPEPRAIESFPLSFLTVIIVPLKRPAGRNQMGLKPTSSTF